MDFFGNTENAVVETKDIVVPVAYLLGQKKEVFKEYFPDHLDQVEELEKDQDANIIRYLSKIRTSLFQNYKKTNDMRRRLVPIDRMEWFDAEEIAKLRSAGIETVLANKSALEHAVELNRHMERHIDACKKLFPEWLNFGFIRDLFVIPKYEKKTIQAAEFEKYWNNRMKYPYQFYIHWEPVDAGNILTHDKKFLKVVYEQHKERFIDISKTHDALDSTKFGIYNFINSANSVIICVDCENCNPYKFYGALCNLDKDQTSKIKKIILYDDRHTTMAWDYISALIHIDVEHIEVNRIVNRKSLVDIRMTAGICKEHYKEDVDSFILCSSDSDFWGLIETLNKANFLVMYEHDICSNAVKDAFNSNRIHHCSLDDFYTGNALKLQDLVLKKLLSERLYGIIGKDAWAITRDLYSQARINATESEMRLFYEKYMKNLKLRVNANGVFAIEIPD